MTCGTCKYVTDWSRTPTGRIRRFSRMCQWQPVKPVVAACITVEFRKIYVAPDDHPNCPTYEKGDSK